MNVKNTVKRLLILIYGFFRKDTFGKIIYYHDVSRKYTNQGTPIELFKKHMALLHKKGFEIVSEIPSKNKEVMICFDDGWRGVWDYRQYFIDKGIHPTVFLIVDFIGKEGYLSKHEILKLQSYGFKFQGHTYSHKNVTEVFGDELQRELVESRIVLSNLLNHKVDEFCFPRGEYSDDLVRKALYSGYNRVYICTPGNADKNDKVLKRNLVQKSTPNEFFAILNGGLGLFRNHVEKLHHK